MEHSLFEQLKEYGYWAYFEKEVKGDILNKIEDKVKLLEVSAGNQEKKENTKAIGKRIQELHWVLDLLK